MSSTCELRNLYTSLWSIQRRQLSGLRRLRGCGSTTRWQQRAYSQALNERATVDVNQYDHLNPQPPDYSSTPFTDACTLTVQSGAGGHGCIAFLREKYIANGPANGGDGGTGGNIFIQAVRDETSLHKIARRRLVKAGRGKNGQGDSRGGKRGDDVVLVVPVGTVIREVRRKDPVAEELAQNKKEKVMSNKDAAEQDSNEAQVDDTPNWRRDKWLLYPGALPTHFTSADFPPLPRPRRSNLALTAPSAPIRFDLDKPMTTPILLAAGAMGGLGNPHFVTNSIPRPKYATRGDEGITLEIQLELKLLADVGLVGLPNAGKSTLLRALTSSRARIGSWAFTTLTPNIGTVVLDSMSGPVSSKSRQLRDASTGELRTHFTIADIPGLIEGAHLDKGLGLDFLRHIERASALAFVVDLSAGDAVQALKGLWAELREYEKLRNMDQGTHNPGQYQPFSAAIGPFVDESNEDVDVQSLPPLTLPPIHPKPWMVVATKADLPKSQVNFTLLNRYLADVQSGVEEHPSGIKHAWRAHCRALPVCALKKENTENVLTALTELLHSSFVDS